MRSWGRTSLMYPCFHAVDHVGLDPDCGVFRLGVGGWTLGQQTGQNRRRRLLSRRPKHALVAARHQHGGDHIQYGHPQPCHRPRAPARRRRQLGLVGVSVDGHGDGVCLRTSLAPFRRPHGHQLLRAALRREVGGVFARVSRALSRIGIQCLGHGHGQFGRDQTG